MTVGCYSVLGHMYKPSQDTYHTQDSMLGWFTLHYITLNFLQLSYRRTICEDIMQLGVTGQANKRKRLMTALLTTFICQEIVSIRRTCYLCVKL